MNVLTPQKVPESGIRDHRRDFLRKTSQFRKVIWGGPKLKIIHFFKLLPSLLAKYKKMGLTCLNSYQEGIIGLSALCVW